MGRKRKTNPKQKIAFTADAELVERISDIEGNKSALLNAFLKTIPNELINRYNDNPELVLAEMLVEASKKAE